MSQRKKRERVSTVALVRCSDVFLVDLQCNFSFLTCVEL